MENFDFFHIPLSGTRLVEASAGTGKTYTIAGLFIRLLLEKGLTVDQILVVTYTKAATEELKTRIRSRMVEARNDFASGRGSDDLLETLLKTFPDHRRARLLLGDALADFDRAAIFTIHGFCQRFLHENAFETGNLYDTELVTDSGELQREIAEDFWRIHFYTAPSEWISFAARNGISDPSYFEQLAAGCHFLEAEIIPCSRQPQLSALEPYRRQFAQLTARWPQSRQAVLELLHSPALDGRTYGSLRNDNRQVRLEQLAAEMDRFTGARNPEFPPVAALEKFTIGGLQRAARRGHRPPQHELFEVCHALQECARDLESQMRQLALHLKTEFFRWAAAESDRRKQMRNIQHYDDLLLAVKKALNAGPESVAQLLVQKACSKYRAALVDEFQDTDAVQYEIFSKLFGTASNPLFIIGDPKQSIYSFRGADVFSYMQAAAGADSRYTLQHNWRSQHGLIKAVNTLFSGTRAPFLLDSIPYAPVHPGRRPEPDAKSTEPSLVLWYLPSADSRPVNKTEAVPAISEAVGDEISRLVHTPADPVAAADIAVLVRTNRQAQIVKESLAKREIPAVLYSSGSVFAAREALELQRVLAGVLEHATEARFRSALATDMIGVSGDALARADERPAEWENLRQRFQHYADLWKRFGFIRMFRTLLAREKVRGRLLAHVDGERRLTNLLHLAEVLHRTADERQLTASGLLKWLIDRRANAPAGQEEHQLRLESDERAVKIVTVHKSKGLEYPIVFCPFAWEGSKLREEGQAIFHSPAAGGRLTIDLGSEQLEDHRVLAQREVLAENLRLLYVAVTRAKTRCYLVWGRINTAETSAPAYLFHLSDAAAEMDVLTAMQRRFAAMNNEELMADLRAIAERSKGSIALQVLPDRPAANVEPAAAGQPELACPVFSGKIESSWRINSFSAMISRQGQDAGLPDHDVDLQLPTAIAGEPPAEGRGASDRRTIFDFPRGARAGIFFHDLLERLDFSPAAVTGRHRLIAAKLKQYGYDAGWQSTLQQAVENLLQVRMPVAGQSFSLSDVDAGSRVNEMQFYFPQKPFTPRRLGRIFSRRAGGRMPAEWLQSLQKLSFSATRGFLTGYVDMLFMHADRFYLLDWKSNHLGDHLENYAAARLADAMVSEHYILQYCLYTVAADRYLRLHRPGYRYEEHFGGVFYLFIRGVDPSAGSASGIFYDRPDPGLVRALDEALVETEFTET